MHIGCRELRPIRPGVLADPFDVELVGADKGVGDPEGNRVSVVSLEDAILQLRLTFHCPTSLAG